MNIGDAGEELLNMWATQAGIGVVEPKRDRRGWDRILEFPAVDSAGPLDKLPAELECKVQVKSTRTASKRRWPVKLDNWQRFATSPLPCFFLIFRFDEEDSVSDAYLVHVDETQLSQVLRRLRKETVGAGGKTPTSANSLHRKSMAVTWTDKNRLAELSGKCLAATIRDIVGDPGIYTASKQSFLQNAGYDDRVRGSFRVPGRNAEDIFERMTDFAIGIGCELPVIDFQTLDERFGMVAPEPEIEPAAVSLTHAEPDIDYDATLTLVAPDRLRRVALPCRIRSSSWVFPDVPDDHTKLRCYRPGIECIIRKAKRRADFRIRIEPWLALRDAGLNAEALLLSHESRSDGINANLRIETPGGPAKLSLSASVPALDTAAVSQCHDIVNAATVASFFRLESALATPLGELVYDRDQVVAMATVVSHRDVKMTISAVLDSKPAAADELTVILASFARIGAHVTIAVFAVSGGWHYIADTDDSTVEVTGRPSLVHHESVSLDDWSCWVEDELPQRLDAAMLLMEQRGASQVVVLESHSP